MSGLARWTQADELFLADAAAQSGSLISGPINLIHLTAFNARHLELELA